MKTQCKICGKEIQTWPSRIKEGKTKYCSKECMSKGYQSGYVERFWSNVDKTINNGSGCWYWTGRLTSTGYGRFNAFGREHKASRFSYELHYGPIGDRKKFVCHKCDNPLCVNPDHLFLGDVDINTKDAARKTRIARGERNTNAKLTVRDVKKIKQLIGKQTHVRIAEQFNVSKSSICDIVAGRTWSHVA